MDSIDFAKEIMPINLEDEMRRSYLDYAMSVIVGRALPDARDGLKPVHRRVMYAMHQGGNAYNKPYDKSSAIVGDVMKKFHPHGDAAIYDTVVRLAQDFSMRYPLVDGQGNFGSIDGDPAAAMRYTEVRMARIAHSLLTDIDKETVDFMPNYNGRFMEPAVLPTRFPNLLVNGSSGIAVGMATNIPPHNLGETINACLHLIEHPAASIGELMRFLPGPDFPTAALINGVDGIRQAYETGKGRIHIRAKTHIESEDSGKQTIVVDELPYQVNKARLLEKIGELVKEKRIDGITALRDESDKDGIRMVIEVRRGETAEVILNNLFQLTQLEVVFGMNMVALVGGQPRLLSLKDMLEVFIAHRREVVTRRTIFELRKARERAHILEGLAIALNNIDEVIALIKASPSPAEAKDALMARAWFLGQVTDMLARAGADNSRPDGLDEHYGLHGNAYHLSPEQAQAILDLRLHRLTGLEQDKIVDEYQNILDSIADYLEILRVPARLTAVICDELKEIRDQFSDPRRTEILHTHLNLSTEDLIAEEDVVITLSHEDYIKAQPLSVYNAQRRGGKGKLATSMKDKDFIEQLFIANTHDTMLCFSNRGRVYWLKVYELPQAGRMARGKPMVQLLPFEEGERLNAVLTTRDYAENRYLLFATRKGIVKKTPLSEYSRPRQSGIIALNLREDDELVDVAITDGNHDIMLFSNSGKAVRFSENSIRPSGRNSSGVIGIRLDAMQHVIALVVVENTGDILTTTVNGYGKRTALADYPCKSRGTKGVISINTSERNGEAIAALQVNEEDEIMLVTLNGTLVRIRAAEVSVSGRNTQGVRLIKTEGDETLIAVAKIVPEDDDSEADESNTITATPSEDDEP